MELRPSQNCPRDRHVHQLHVHLNPKDKVVCMQIQHNEFLQHSNSVNHFVLSGEGCDASSPYKHSTTFMISQTTSMQAEPSCVTRTDCASSRRARCLSRCSAWARPRFLHHARKSRTRCVIWWRAACPRSRLVSTSRIHPCLPFARPGQGFLSQNQSQMSSLQE